MRKYSYVQETGGNLTYVNTSIQTAHKEINNTHTHTHREKKTMSIMLTYKRCWTMIQ